MKKIYLALVEGHVSSAQGTIETAIMEHGCLEKHRTYDACTHFNVLKRYEHVSLVRFQPVTGRKHQIRRHASSMGTPLVGDRRYGGSGHLLTRPALHAAKIVFNHPFTNTVVSVTASLPEDFQMLLDTINSS